MQRLMEAFARRVDAEGLAVEGIRIYQGDRFVTGHRWVADRPRNIYSHTKSYMATAIGIAVSEGLLTLDDRPSDLLPEALPPRPAPGLSAITLRHLLMMSSGLKGPLLMSAGRSQGSGAPDYAAYVLSQPLLAPPGERFFYSNGDSFLAGRMLEVRAGQTLRDFLQARVFTPLGIAYPEWEHDPQGHTFGASGLRLALDDMMKLGRLYLKGGRWDGQQLVDPAWIAEATALQIDTPDAPDNPWHIGYGYQFWRSPYPHAYRADGMYGQITTVLPEADAVVAIQCAESETPFDGIRSALHEEVLSQIR